jgi:lipopolysaccharide/colanic/teichoic acid biosynthesis glycosyltransferase
MLKRALDISGALGGLIVSSPFFLLAAVAVKVTSRGPVFFRGSRIGRNGVPFQVLKFRSMTCEPGSGQPRITRAGDPRVTPMGRFLRRTKLDELPQLVNVLRGEMSLVGPRPEDPRYVALYSDEQRTVLDVRPGLTSPASLAFRDEESLLIDDDWEVQYRTRIMPEKLRIELEYLRRRTFLSDLGIVFRTIAAMIR